MKKIIFSSLFILALTACNNDDPNVVYQVQNEYVGQPGADKPSVKTSTEYISIVYSDIYGKTISTNDLEELKTIYISFGDVATVEDLIVRNFLKDPEANLPSDADMRLDIEKFVNDSYKKFYNRDGTDKEIWFHSDLIKNNAELTPDVFYFGILTSNEYRQY